MSLKLGRKGKEAFIEPHPPTPNYLFKEGLWEALDYGVYPFLHILRNQRKHRATRLDMFDKCS